MKRLMLVVGFSVVAVALIACGPVTPNTADQRTEARPVQNSVRVDGIVYRLTVPAAMLKTGTDSSATYYVTNSTDETLTANLDPVVTISSSEGTLQLWGIPLNANYTAMAKYLGPGQAYRKQVAFKVPAPGSCAIEMHVTTPGNDPLVVEFESIETQ